MLLTITAPNVNGMWDAAKVHLNSRHILRPSRTGEVIEYPAPVISEYLNPKERVLFNSERNANPIFHFMEALWMLAGRDDVDWIADYNPRMKLFSDDGKVFHGAYGARWRTAFDLDGGAEDDYADQLLKVIRMLKKSSDERRAVIAMWNPIWDLERPEIRDLPCNTQIYLKIREGRLTVTVCCRSNDVCWGAYGSNVVHMSMLQEYLAAMIGVPVGTYWQISDSWHAYTERWQKFGGESTIPTRDYYTEGLVATFPMVDTSIPGYEETWDQELRRWMRGDILGSYTQQFFPQVATQLFMAWTAYKSSDLDKAMMYAHRCLATDWSMAVIEWLDRIRNKRTVAGSNIGAR